jgi:hypothetical protein
LQDISPFRATQEDVLSVFVVLNQQENAPHVLSTHAAIWVFTVAYKLRVTLEIKQKNVETGVQKLNQAFIRCSPYLHVAGTKSVNDAQARALHR